MELSETIRKAADEIEQVLEKNNVPRPNPNAVNRIRFIARSLRGVAGYAAEKGMEISFLAEDFYSARKHYKYRGGADEIYARMTYDLLGRMRNQADRQE